MISLVKPGLGSGLDSLSIEDQSENAPDGIKIENQLSRRRLATSSISTEQAGQLAVGTLDPGYQGKPISQMRRALNLKGIEGPTCSLEGECRAPLDGVLGVRDDGNSVMKETPR